VHIVVLIKQVPATDNVRMDQETGTMVRTGQNNIMNPLDENALAEAVRIKETVPGVSITAISMGPESAGKVFKEAVALGADAGILVTGRAFAGSDTIATARALAVAVAKAGPADLILCGERATEGETGQTGVMVAATLDLPVQTCVSRIDVADGRVRVVRTVEDGFEKVEVPFPVLVSVVKDINQPGFPTLDGKSRARSVPVTVWGPEELGLAPDETGLKGSPTRVVKIFSPRLTREDVLRKHG
jgi:electron transfer flavoprotein beta subunit